MSVEVLMPALSPTMKTGHLVKWHKKEGDRVEIGDLLAEIETDKATMEVEAADDGTLGAILVVEGTKNVAVNTPIAMLLQDGESMDTPPSQKAKPVNNGKIPDVPMQDPVASLSTKEIPHPNNDDTTRVKASPLARRMAKQSGISLDLLQGTGPSGRIVKRDVENALLAPPSLLTARASGSDLPMSPLPVSTPTSLTQENTLFSGYEPDFDVQPVSGMREVIAQRLWESKHQMPHFYLSLDVDMSSVMSLRKRFIDGQDVKLSLNDFVLKAVAHALACVPEVNSAWASEGIRHYTRVDLAVAVSIEGGLVTPVIRDATSKGLKNLSIEMKELASKARAGSLKPEEFQGGTFTVSSLGMFGIDVFSAIINPPQAGILAVGAVKEVPVVRSGQVVVQPRMTLTASVDHRVVDGVIAARFLGKIKAFLEGPAVIFI